MDRVLVPYALEIAEAAVEEMPQYSWGSTVLAATYRGLCKASVQNKHNAIFTGCPILLQLWSYERIAIVCPIINHSPYEPDMYGDTEDNRPPWGLSGMLVRYGNECYSYYSVGNSVALFDPLCISYWYILLLILCRSVGPMYSPVGSILTLWLSLIG